MARKKKYRCKRKIRGKGKPYVLNNKVYFGIKQRGNGILICILDNLVNAVGSTIGI